MTIEEKEVKEIINLMIEGKIEISNIYFYLEGTGYIQAGILNLDKGSVQIIVDSPYRIEDVEFKSTDKLFIIK
jgi:hypothetical protein